MKGKTLVIGIILFVILVVAAVYFSMMSTINKIKEENKEETTLSVIVEDVEIPTRTLNM